MGYVNLDNSANEIIYSSLLESKLKNQLRLMVSCIEEDAHCILITPENKCCFDRSETTKVFDQNEINNVLQHIPEDADYFEISKESKHNWVQRIMLKDSSAVFIAVYQISYYDQIIATILLKSPKLQKLSKQQQSVFKNLSLQIKDTLVNHSLIVENNKLQNALAQVVAKMNETNSFANKVNQSLEIMGKALNVSKVYIFENFDNNTRGRNTFEWCNKGIRPEIDNFQNISYSEDIASFIEPMLEDNGLLADNIEELSPDMKDLMTPQGIHAIALFPMFNKGDFFGLIGFDENKGPRKWTKNEIQLLRTFTQIISNSFIEYRSLRLLNEAKLTYESLYENTPAMMHSIDKHGRLISVSRYWLEKMGYDQEEVIGRKSSDFLSEESKEFAEKEVFPAFLNTGSCTNVPYEWITKNGKTLNVLLSAITEYDASGSYVRSLAVMADVTKEKAAEEALRKLNNSLEERIQSRTKELEELSKELAAQKELLQSVFDHTDLSIFVKDLSGKFLVVNKACCRHAGLTEQDMIGKSDYDFFPQEEADEFREFEELVIANKSIMTHEETATVDGKILYNLVSKFPLLDSNGNPKALCGIITNITSVKQQQYRMRKQTNHLDEMTEEFKQFSCSLSQELVEPISDILILSRSLADTNHEKLDKISLNNLELINRNAQQIDLQVRNWQKFTSSTNRKIEQQYDQIDRSNEGIDKKGNIVKPQFEKVVVGVTTK